MSTPDHTRLVEFLSGFVTPARLAMFDRVLEKRTRYLTVVLEDLFQPHNASAVLRSCDCFGIQDVHIIENRNVYMVNPDITLGSSNWLSLIRYNSKQNNTPDAIRSIKEKGYRIIAATPHTDGIPPERFDPGRGKAALVFGTEMEGLSPPAFSNADEFVQVPMVGFTKSLNISVAAAIILHHLTTRLWNSGLPWQLTDEEKQELKLTWLKRTLKKSDLLIRKFEEGQV